MTVQTRFEMDAVVHFLSILLSLILLHSFIVYAEEIASGEENENKNGESFCETSYENRNVWKSNMRNTKQVLQCNSTQPINWIIQSWDNKKASIGKEKKLPFKIETKLVTCKTRAAPNSNSNSTITTTRTIPYYFTSTLTPTTTITLSKSADPIKMYFFCGNLAFTSSDSFPWSCTVFKTDGKTSKCSGSSSRSKHPKITLTLKPDCAELVLADDHSSGTCACNGKEESYSFLPCKDLTSCRLLAEAKHDTLCEAEEVRNLCNITSLRLPDSNKIQGGILYCKLSTRIISPYVVFLDIPQRSVIQSMTPCKGESRLTEIQILGDPTESFEQFLELSLVYPTNESGIARKTGAWIKCRGLAFVFVQGFLWTVEFKDNKTEPKFSISDYKVEFSSDGRKYLSSWLTILPDNGTLSSVVNVTCSAFVNDRNFSVQSNLTIKLQGYNSNVEPVVKFPVGVLLKYNCHPKRRKKGVFIINATWHQSEDSSQGLKMKQLHLQGSNFLETNAENLVCAVTLPNGRRNSHNLTRNQCKNFVKEHNCTEILDMRTTTKKAEPTSKTTTKTTTETWTVASNSSGTVSTNSTATLTTTGATITSPFTLTPVPAKTKTTATSTSTVATTTQNSPNNQHKSSPTPGSTSTGPGKQKEGNDVTIVVSGVLGLCLLILFPCVIILMRKNRKQRDRLKMSDADVNDFLKGNDSVHFIPYDTRMEIPKDKITIGTKVLGSGEFGKVVEGQYNEKRVAIKTVKKSANIMYFKALLSEIKIMGFVGKHENVLQLIGACTREIKTRNVYAVFELCENGNLVRFLRQNRDNFENQPPRQSDKVNGNQRMSMISMKTAKSKPERKMTTRDLVRWSFEIACGMDVIAQKKIYHGDLAARNILLDGNLVAKVGDFGLSRQLFEYSVYVQKMSCPLPLKWMSIESLRDLEFSIQSDVWSFGITLWEIFSLGCQPYPNVLWNFTNWKQLLDGERMEKPDQASNSIYYIMLKCWLEKPTERPTFAQLKTMFEEELKKLEDNIEKIPFAPLIVKTDSFDFSSHEVSTVV